MHTCVGTQMREHTCMSDSHHAKQLFGVLGEWLRVGHGTIEEA